MNKSYKSIAIIWILLASGFLGICSFNQEVVEAYISRDYIYINGNDNFTSEKGVVGGSGTRTDPYIIEGWELKDAGVNVRDTDAHFIIKDCHISSGDFGIKLFRVANCIIEKTNITANSYEGGISIRDSSNITIRNNTLHKNYDEGCIIYGSKNISIEYNDFTYHEQDTAISIKDSTINVTVKNNLFFMDGSGITIYQSSNCEIFCNFHTVLVIILNRFISSLNTNLLHPGTL